MIFTIRKKWILLAVVTIFASLSWYIFKVATSTETASTSAEHELEIQMVTSEIKSKTADGKEIESYRWDPGTIYIPVDEKVKLSIYGVNGHEHPFYIENTDIKGTVKKGEETVLDLHFKEEGIYRLICTTHAHINDNGPMIAYIVVD